MHRPTTKEEQVASAAGYDEATDTSPAPSAAQSRRSALQHICKLLRVCQQRGAYSLEEASHLHGAVVHTEKLLEDNVDWVLFEPASVHNNDNTVCTAVASDRPVLSQEGAHREIDAPVSPLVQNPKQQEDFIHIHTLFHMCQIGQSKGGLTLYEAWTAYNAILIFSNTTPDFV